MLIRTIPRTIPRELVRHIMRESGAAPPPVGNFGTFGDDFSDGADQSFTKERTPVGVNANLGYTGGYASTLVVPPGVPPIVSTNGGGSFSRAKYLTTGPTGGAYQGIPRINDGTTDAIQSVKWSWYIGAFQASTGASGVEYFWDNESPVDAPTFQNARYSRFIERSGTSGLRFDSYTITNGSYVQACTWLSGVATGTHNVTFHLNPVTGLVQMYKGPTLRTSGTFGKTGAFSAGGHSCWSIIPRTNGFVYSYLLDIYNLDGTITPA